MNLAHPQALLLLLFLVPVALLYWLRVRAPQRIVGTGLFWQKALAEEKVRWRWQAWRSKFSLAVQMLLVVLIALAAAGPQIPPAKRMVLIIDNSATMRATDVQPTRLDVAKEVARRLIGSLRSCDEMALVRVSPAPIEVRSMTSDQALLATAIDSIEATAGSAAIEWAVKLAGEIAVPEEDRLKLAIRSPIPPRMVLITDGCSREAVKLAQQSGVEVLHVGTAAGNLAITCFTARRSKAEPAKCEVLVEVRNQGNQSAMGSVTLTASGTPGQSAPFSIVKDGCWQHVYTSDLPAAARLTAKIEPGDAYLFDDTAQLDVPAAPARRRVKLASDEQSCLKGILAANRRVELIQGDAEAKAIQVIDGKTPQQVPAGPALVFTPGACDLWQLGAAVTDPLITRVDQSSPIAAGVRLFDAYLPEARQLQIAEPVRGFARPILWAGVTPLGYAIDRPQGRVVVVAGDLATSNLALQAAFPQFIDQALDWLAGQPLWKDEIVGWDQRGLPSAGPPSDAVGGPAHAQGELVPPYATDHARLESPASGGTDIRISNDTGNDASALVLPKPQPPLWIVPAVLAAVLLIIEWCLYQRRWTS